MLKYHADGTANFAPNFENRQRINLKIFSEISLIFFFSGYLIDLESVCAVAAVLKPKLYRKYSYYRHVH